MKHLNLGREVLNPLSEIDPKDIKINILPDDFESISLVDNTKPGADTILSLIEEDLGNRNFHYIKKPAGAPATPGQIAKAASAELVIMALGDCGSCTSWVVFDALKIEKKGIPTIIICSDHFSNFARELALTHGASDLRIIEIQHPIAGLSREEIEIKAQKTLKNLRYLLQIP